MFFAGTGYYTRDLSRRLGKIMYLDTYYNYCVRFLRAKFGQSWKSIEIHTVLNVIHCLLIKGKPGSGSGGANVFVAWKNVLGGFIRAQRAVGGAGTDGRI